MEFFKELHQSELNIPELKNLLTIKNLTNLCASISAVTPHHENEGDIYCVWGAFTVSREEIKCGVRFSLVNCPHALAWTITFSEEDKAIIIHCTIDKKQQDRDFIDSIQVFVTQWSSGITSALKNKG